MGAYIVTAGYVTVETEQPGGNRAHVDVPRGQPLPDDVPQAQIDWELRLGTIEPVKAPKPEPASSASPELNEAEPPAVPTSEPETDPNALPPGMSVATTLTWVGADQARIEVALEAEKLAASPRATLIDRLEKQLASE